MEAFIVKTRPNKDRKDCLVVTVKCPHCKKTHSHGVHKLSSYNEHRVADCFKGTYTFNLTAGRSTA